jgi:hypothetical protein
MLSILIGLVNSETYPTFTAVMNHTGGLEEVIVGNMVRLKLKETAFKKLPKTIIGWVLKVDLDE